MRYSNSCMFINIKVLMIEKIKMIKLFNVLTDKYHVPDKIFTKSFENQNKSFLFHTTKYKP